MAFGELHRCSPMTLASVLWIDHDVPDPPRGVVARVVAADPEVADDVVRVVDEVEHRVVRGGSTRREGPIERVAGVLFGGAWRLACSDQVRLVLGLAPLPPRGK